MRRPRRVEMSFSDREGVPDRLWMTAYDYSSSLHPQPEGETWRAEDEEDWAQKLTDEKEEAPFFDPHTAGVMILAHGANTHKAELFRWEQCPGITPGVLVHSQRFGAGYTVARLCNEAYVYFEAFGTQKLQLEVPADGLRPMHSPCLQ